MGEDSRPTLLFTLYGGQRPMKNCREVCDYPAIQPVSGPMEGLGHTVPRMAAPAAAAPWILSMEQQ